MKEYDVIIVGSGAGSTIVDGALSHGHACSSCFAGNHLGYFEKHTRTGLSLTSTL